MTSKPVRITLGELLEDREALRAELLQARAVVEAARVFADALDSLRPAHRSPGASSWAMTARDRLVDAVREHDRRTP